MIGGTLNQSSMFLMKATQVGNNSSVTQIVKLVQEAQTNKVIQNKEKKPEKDGNKKLSTKNCFLFDFL